MCRKLEKERFLPVQIVEKLYHLVRCASSRYCGESHNITEVNRHHLKELGVHDLLLFELFCYGLGQHLIEQSVGFLLFLFQLDRFVRNLNNEQSQQIWLNGTKYI